MTGSLPADGSVADLVVTLDADGVPIGTADKHAAHRPPGTRHLAFSVVVFDDAERMLLQRRAVDKPTFGGWWANACCSHPRPGEPVLDAARRRVDEELGVELVNAVERGRFSYVATDPDTGLVENELDVVVSGTISGELDLDTTEIAEVAWFTRVELAGAGLRRAPWLDGVLRIVGWAG